MPNPPKPDPAPAPPAESYETIGQLPATVPTVGSFLGAVAFSAAQADSMLKDAAMHRIQALLTPDKDGKVPSIEMAAGIDIPAALTGGDAESLDVRWSMPQVGLEPDRMLAITKATADWHMEVHARSTDKSDLHAMESGTGQASLGWGPFKASISISARASQSEEKQKSNSTSCVLDAHMEFGQLPVSETFSRMMAAQRRFVDKGTDVLDRLVDLKAQEIAVKTGVAVPDADGNPPTPPDKAGGGKGGGKGDGG